MPVTEFECAIAKSQIGRYINGEKLGQAVVDQLESHIAACPRCKLVLEEKRNSLMSTIEADRQERIRTTIEPVPMKTSSGNMAPQLDSPRPETFGALARKFAEPVEGDAKAELRKQLEAMANKRTGYIDIPVTAPAAFAHRELAESTTPRVAEEEPIGKKNLMAAFALFKRTNEPEAENAPANPAHDVTMKKPIAYMAGLTTVVIAMSLIAKNPTTMFGPKANDARVATKAPVTKPKTEAAQRFAAIREKSKKAQAAKLAALKKKAAAQDAAKKKPVITGSTKPKAKAPSKTATQKATPAVAKRKPAPSTNLARVVSKRTTSAQRFKSSKKSSVKRAPKAPENGTVKVYAPN